MDRPQVVGKPFHVHQERTIHEPQFFLLRSAKERGAASRPPPKHNDDKVIPLLLWEVATVDGDGYLAEHSAPRGLRQGIQVYLDSQVMSFASDR
jgi:hypothetical protein